MGAEEHEHTEEPVVETNGDSPLVRRLRAAREKAREREFLDLPVPGYEDEDIAIRYKPIPREDWLKMSEADEEADEADFDALTDACAAVLVKDEDDQYQILLDENTEQPVRFDTRLAEFLSLEAEDAREVIHGVFNLDRYPLAYSVHTKAIIRWSQGLDVKANKNLLGESLA